MSIQTVTEKQDASTLQNGIVVSFATLKKNVEEKSDKVPSLLTAFCETVHFASQHNVDVSSTTALNKINISPQMLQEALHNAIQFSYLEHLKQNQSEEMQKLSKAEEYFKRHRKEVNALIKEKSRIELSPKFDLGRFAKLRLGMSD